MRNDEIPRDTHKFTGQELSTKTGYFYTTKNGEVKFRKNKKGPWLIVTTPKLTN